ncbi:hypothetical protein EGS93_18570 [Salmonella enterica]|nr:hypothetical protein [Salmonella enterica]ECG1409764.1 hypothetical protein [Salmonella enterica subsp. enterica serovar Derby str. CFSAN000566]EDE2918707.1 hypothetical protein [Salmonella enterica subsp. enterica serovar Typhimurium]HAE4578468.1 hypothetical protein [Salmonella enterica subsp. enterica serovar Derby]HAU7715873.1 hypothetical protein [Salmonella enterica subsp. enterica]
MKLGNAVSLFFTAFLEGFSYRFCPVWDKALDRLIEEGTLLEVRDGIALFERDANLYEVFVGAGFKHFGHLVSVNTKVIDDSVMRRPSFRVMDKLQRRVTAEILRSAKEKERELQVMINSLLAD